MQFSTAILAFSMASLAIAELHKSAVCYDVVGGQNVYNADATQKACGNYFMRNTGGEHWDTCPDCALKTVGGVTFCNSDAGHIGGDEILYYCNYNGAGESMTD